MLASCTSAGDPNLDVGVTGYNSASMVAPAPAGAGDRMTDGTVSKADGKALPEQVAQLPATSPATASPAETSQTAEVASAQAGAEAPATGTAAATKQKPADEAASAAEKSAEATPADQPGKQPKDTAGAEAKPSQVIATAAEWPQSEQAPKKKGFLSSFFGATPAAAAPSPIRQDRNSAAVVSKKPSQAFIENRPGKPLIEEPAPAKAAEKQEPAKPIIDLDAEPTRKPVVLASYGGGADNGLPGVRTTALFEIKRKSGIDDESDIDLHEEDDEGPVRLASAAGMARLAPNGLLKQTESVDVACLKPSLVRVLKTIEQRFGRKLVVTSGYRSRSYNMRVRGAKNSQHMYCAAADIQVPGVSKWELANFARSLPGRGGVGTYCHTNSVHVDIGPERDWNWRCRRRG